MNPQELFAEVPVLIVGGVATRAYMPERQTKDLDVLVKDDCLSAAEQRLAQAGFVKRGPLAFPSTSLGLRGNVWAKGDVEVDLISSSQEWCVHAFEGRVEDQTGLRVAPLPYLVLMKYDAARGVDQGDLTRMLGRLDEHALQEVIAVVARYSQDPDAENEIRQYAQLGRWEWENQA